jgi:nucleoside-diphosphate-sugar epimerase
MKIFVSGASGYIGSRLVLRLANEGHIIHALYRSENKSEAFFNPNIKFFKGDILEIESLKAAMEGCEQAYHTAAFTKVWDSDPSRIYRLNIEGTINVIKTGIEAGVKKFVCTSTAGMYGPSGKVGLTDEKSIRPDRFFIHYESSKAILEQVLRTISKSGISIVIVNPTRVYGPGLLSQSNGVTRMIKKYAEGRWRIIPGNGKSTGNYVYVEDVVTGHILAMNKGKAGENYILGGSNISYNELFKELAEISGKKHLMIHIPLWIMLLAAHVIYISSKISGKNPLITPPLVKKFLHEWNVSSAKAINELGYSQVSIETGLKNTLDWINSMK